MKVVAIADSDSYAKWAAALLTRMPADWQVELVLLRTPKIPSAAQLEAATSNSRIAASDVSVLDFARAVTHVVSERPDVVLVSTIGPLADLVSEAVLGQSDHRPVIVSGLPGMALPARRKALIYRSQVDLLVLHSKREVRRFVRVAAANGFAHKFGLATLPFMATETPTNVQGRGEDILFAAQAIVPATRAQRALLLGWLVDFAVANPAKRVVIKVRAVEGEGQTHDESDSFAALLAARTGAPANLVVESGPMAERLRTASALVTVSSTAALEAIALGIPVLALDEFGVNPAMLNEVFLGSGLLGSAADLRAGNFKSPDENWLKDNYFHSPEDNTWLPLLRTLVEANREKKLPARPRVIRGSGGALRRAWDRKRVLGSGDRSVLGYVALAIGMPLRTLVLSIGELRSLVVEESIAREPVALDDGFAPLSDDRDLTGRSR